MKTTSFIINLTSDNPDRLRAFYRDTIGLVPNPEMGDAMAVMPGVNIAIDGHSDTHGIAKEPQRLLIDFFVDDLQAEQARLEGRGVEFIRKAGREYWGGVISTFLDPDGNYCQLIEYRPD